MRTARVLLVDDPTKCFSDSPRNVFGTEKFGFGVVHVSSSDPYLIAKVQGGFYRLVVIHILPWESHHTLEKIRIANEKIPILAVLAQGIQELALRAIERDATVCIPMQKYTLEPVVSQICDVLFPKGKPTARFWG